MKKRLKRLVIRSPEDITQLVKARREELGVSQKDLAKFCNLSHNGISKMETHKSEIKLTTLLKISQFLGIKLVLEMEE